MKLNVAMLSALLGTGCILPTLLDLENERARSCNEEHPCATGYACVEGVCKKGAVAACNATDTKSCGTDVGECVAGTQTCSGGTFGACMGEVTSVTEVCDGKDNDCNGTTDDNAVTTACELTVGVCQGKKHACVSGTPEATCGRTSYGLAYEVTETRCDRQDNDCDGQTDENLATSPCSLNQGICAGATIGCTNGMYPACTATEYLQRDTRYEVAESSCDSVDNDCDGVADILVPTAFSDGGVTLSRRPVAVLRSGSNDVLTMYESGNKLVARVLYADGGVSSERIPSTSVATAAMRAELPAVATAGTVTVEGWFEVLPGPIYRLVLGNSGPSGESLVGGSPGVFPPLSANLPGAGQSLKLGLTSARIVMAYAFFDVSGANSSVSVTSCPLDLASLCTTSALGNGRNPSLFVEGNTAVVAWDDPSSGIKVAKLNIDPGGPITTSANGSFGALGDHDVTVMGALSSLNLFWVANGSPQSLSRRTGDCTGACAVASFTVTSGLATFVGTPSSFSWESRLVAPVLGWEEGPAAARVAKVMRLGGTPVDIATTGSRRPTPLMVNPNAPPIVLFDGEGATGSLSNLVALKRFCSL